MANQCRRAKRGVLLGNEGRQVKSRAQAELMLSAIKPFSFKMRDIS